MAGSTNVQGEDVKKLDVLSNELFVNMLASSYTVHMMVSEENETVIEVRDHNISRYDRFVGSFGKHYERVQPTDRINAFVFIW
jgi:fructose-1,6-bisphosphatase